MIEERRLSDLTPYEGNPRINDAAVPLVAESISRYGFKVPVVVDRNGVIIAGHTRCKAAESLGMERVPCIVAEDLTDEQVRAYRLADNRVSELATWDEELLRAELEDLINLGSSMEELGISVDPGEIEVMAEDVPGENGYEYQEEYAINVVCEDEEAQERTLEELTEMGYQCRAVTV